MLWRRRQQRGGSWFSWRVGWHLGKPQCLPSAVLMHRPLPCLCLQVLHTGRELTVTVALKNLCVFALGLPHAWLAAWRAGSALNSPPFLTPCS